MSATEWRAPSKDEDAGLEARGPAKGDDALLLLWHAARLRRHRPGAGTAAAAGGLRAGQPARPRATAGEKRDLSHRRARSARHGPGSYRERAECARRGAAHQLRGAGISRRAPARAGGRCDDHGVGVRAGAEPPAAERRAMGSGALAAPSQAGVRGPAEARAQRAPGVFQAVTWMAEQ